MDSGRWGWLGWVGVMGRKWRQLYLTTIKRGTKRKIKISFKKISQSFMDLHNELLFFYECLKSLF